MIRKNDPELSFVDAALVLIEREWQSHWLRKLLDLVDWRPFDRQFKKLYSHDTGRPAWDPVVLFRCLLLAEWNTLSDRKLREALQFRFDFRKFAGIPLDQEVPDDTTFVVFRNRIQSVWPRLHEELNRQLQGAGFEVQKALAVDATLVEAHSKPKSESGGGGDTDASWRGFPVKKKLDEEGNQIVSRRMALYGYKVNLAASVGQGFVSRFSVCKASEHETHHFQELLSKYTEAVYADKGYVGNRDRMQAKGIRDGIQAKATRGHPLSFADTLRNQRITRKRRIVEGVFGSWKRWCGWRKTRFIGLARNELAVCLTALAWNLKKWAKLSSARPTYA
jgi:IS5 family transposase